MREEISAESKSAEFICASLASIHTFKFRKYIFQLGRLRNRALCTNNLIAHTESLRCMQVEKNSF